MGIAGLIQKSLLAYKFFLSIQYGPLIIHNTSFLVTIKSFLLAQRSDVIVMTSAFLYIKQIHYRKCQNWPSLQLKECRETVLQLAVL